MMNFICSACDTSYRSYATHCPACSHPIARLDREDAHLAGTGIELHSEPVAKLADRLAVAVCGDRQIAGFNVELLSQGVFGPRLNALIAEMADHEAEAYALQDSVEEANASVTALELRLAEAHRVLEETQWHYRAHDDHSHSPSGYYCPVCGSQKSAGHDATCELGAVLDQVAK